MKIFFTLLALQFLLAEGLVYSQSTANYNTERLTNGSLTDMSGSTQLLVPQFTSSNVASAVVNIGFDFWFMGNRYSQFSVNGNGLMRLGPTVVSNSGTNTFLNTANVPWFAPFWDNLNAASDQFDSQASQVRTKVTGTAPARVLTIEWKDFVIAFNAQTTDAFSTFQVRLYEATGKIEFVYGTMQIASGSNNVTASIGFSTGNANNLLLSVTSLDPFTFTTLSASTINNLVNSSTAGPIAALNSALDGERVVYSFTPPNVNAPTNLSFSSITPVSMTLNWEDNSTNELGFAVYRSTDGVNYSFAKSVAANSTSANVDGLTPNTNYHWRVYAFAEGINPNALTGTQATAPSGEYFAVQSGNWNDTATWNLGSIPGPGDNVTVGAPSPLNRTDTNTLVILNEDASCYRLIIEAKGKIIFDSTVSSSVKLTIHSGGIDISPGGEFIIPGNGPPVEHQLEVQGDLGNDGVFTLCENTDRFARLTFNGSDGNDQVWDGEGTNVVKDVIVDIQTNDNSRNGPRLIVDADLFFCGSNNWFWSTEVNTRVEFAGNKPININPIQPTTIPVGGLVEINNPNANILVDGNLHNFGQLNVVSGVIDIGGNVSGGSATKIDVVGGKLNVGKIIWLGQSSAEYSQSGGEVNVAIEGNDMGSLASFGWFGFFTMTGGMIKVKTPSSATSFPRDFQIAFPNNNVHIKGGHLAFEFGPGSLYHILGYTPTITIPSGVTVMTEGTTVIRGDLNVSGNLDANGNSVNIQGNQSAPGDVVNNGEIKNTGTTGTFTFGGQNGYQEYSGTGVMGTPTEPFNNVSFTNPDGATVESQIAVTNLNLQKGDVEGADGSIKLIGDAKITRTEGKLNFFPDFSSAISFALDYLTFFQPIIMGKEVNPQRKIKKLLVNVFSPGIDPSDIIIEGGDITVTDSLKLTNGKIVTDDTNKIVIEKNAIVTPPGGSPDSYVQGPVKMEFQQGVNVTKQFPIGDDFWVQLVMLGEVVDDEVFITARSINPRAPGGTPVSPLRHLNPTRIFEIIAQESEDNVYKMALSYGADDDIGPVGTARVAGSDSPVGDFISFGGEPVTEPTTGIKSTQSVTFNSGLRSINDGTGITKYFVIGNEEGAPAASVTQEVTSTGNYNFNNESDTTSVSIFFNGVTGSGNVEVSLFDSPPSNTSFPPEGSEPTFISQYRWIINQTGLSGIDARVKFYTPEIPDNGITNINEVTIYSRPVSGSGMFTPLITTVSGDTLIAQVNGFSEFIFGSETNPLPVELASFIASIDRRDVHLNWTTANEMNNSGFIVERTLVRSENTPAEWINTGFVQGNGTTNESQSYSFTDRGLNTGKYNYRLKQIDYNGNFEYFNLSNEVTIGVPEKFDLSQNYPNPFNPTTKINFDLPFDSKVTMKVFDLTGREIATLVNDIQMAGYYTVTFDGKGIASGVYFYRIVAEGGSQQFVMTKKMVVVK
jgi:hypothetical protein